MADESNFLYNYYLQQAQTGRGTVYSGPIYMTGHGIGSHLAKIFHTIFPFIQSGAKKIGKEILRTGANIIQDVTEQNMPIRQSFKTRSREAVQRVISGSGYKRKRDRSNDHLHTKRVRLNTIKKRGKRSKKRERDIFD